MRRFLLLILMMYVVPSVSFAAPIHDAAKKGDVVGIAAALDAGADIEAKDGGGTPLYFAVRRGHLAAAKLLMERGANVKIASNYWGDLLTIATVKARVDLITLLLAHGANPNATSGGESALHVAVKYGCLACVKALVEAGADVNAPTYDIWSSYRTPIHLAIRYGYPEVAEYLMEHGVVVPKPARVTAKLAEADPERGRIFFNEYCAFCHYVDQNKGRSHGPNLWGVVGRVKASMTPYSKVLRDWGGTWTYEDLNTYLYGPTFTKPGGLMEVPSIEDDATRADLIVYLRTLSETPMPLP